MQNFTFYRPTKIIFGKGAEDRVGTELATFGAKRVFLVYGGGSVIKSGLLSKIEAQLQKENIAFMRFGGAQANPMRSHAEEGVRLAKEFGADFLLGVGGASSIDTAKAIAVGTANPECVLSDFWGGGKKVEKDLPVGAVLTISAAGSEMSDSAVLTDDVTGVKAGLSTDFNVPKLAFMDPELTFTLPSYQVCCGVVDIMMHTLDRYFTHTKHNETTDALAEALLRTVIRNGRLIMNDTNNYDAASELMWCGGLSHNGITGLGAVVDFAPHKLGHELSAKYGVAHGASLSAVWGSWALYSYREEPERFARYAKEVWGVEKDSAEASALAGIEVTVSYFREIGAPVSLIDLKLGTLPEEDLADMARRCAARGGGHVGNFREIHENDALAIYHMANKE